MTTDKNGNVTFNSLDLLLAFIGGAGLIVAVFAALMTYTANQETVRANERARLNNNLVELATVIQMEPPHQQKYLIAKAKAGQ